MGKYVFVFWMLIMFAAAPVLAGSCNSKKNSSIKTVEFINISTDCESISCDMTKKKAQKIMAKYEKELAQLNQKYTRLLQQDVQDSNYKIIVKASVKKSEQPLSSKG